MANLETIISKAISYIPSIHTSITQYNNTNFSDDALKIAGVIFGLTIAILAAYGIAIWMGGYDKSDYYPRRYRYTKRDYVTRLYKPIKTILSYF